MIQTKPPQPDSWSSTNHQIVKFTHSWIVNDVKFYLNNINDFSRIESPKFSPSNDSTLQFCLFLYPNGDKAASKGHVSIFLRMISCPKSEVTLQSKVSIINGTLKQNTQKFGAKFKPTDLGWGWTKFMTHERLNSLLTNDKLTIFCEIEALVDTIHTTNDTSSRDKQVESKLMLTKVDTRIESQLLDNLGHLLKGSKLSDVVLITGDSTEHRAHKAIIAARSPVFAVMFEQEPNEGRVFIQDISSEVFEEILRFIYTGKVINLDELADKLLIAAAKYELDLLKDICERSLADNLNNENALSMLIFADEHSAKMLRSKSIEYIKANLSTLISTANWNTLELRPNLYFELLSHSIVENQGKIKELTQSSHWDSQWLKSQYCRIPPNWAAYLSAFIIVLGVKFVKSFV